MSGRLQHTIPRFLLKGFASKIHEHDVFVWMYRKDKPGREINTLNVGAENHFYGKTTEPSVDDQITEIEPLYSDLLSELRVTPENCPLEDQRIPTLITHLSMRTRFLRQSMTDSMSFLVDGLRDHLQDDNRLRAALLSDSRVQNLLKKALTARGVDAEQMDEAIALLEPHLPKLKELVPDLAARVDNFVSSSRSAMTGVIRSAHINALSRIPDDDKRAQSYAKLNWFMVMVNTRLLLGDTVCVFETSGKRWFKPVHDAEDDIKKVLLPVSCDRLLLGTPAPVCPSVDVNVINKAIARCSYEYFVSSVSLPLDSPLVRSIGRWSGILSDLELRTINKNL